jgi:hypothetical protein
MNLYCIHNLSVSLLLMDLILLIDEIELTLYLLFVVIMGDHELEL